MKLSHDKEKKCPKKGYENSSRLNKTYDDYNSIQKLILISFLLFFSVNYFYFCFYFAQIARRNFADNANKIIRDKINDNTDFYSDLLQINSELNVRTALGSELMKKIVRSDTLMATLLDNNQAFL